MHHSRSTTGVTYIYIYDRQRNFPSYYRFPHCLWVLPSRSLDITEVFCKGLKRPERKAAYRTVGIADL